MTNEAQLIADKIFKDFPIFKGIEVSDERDMISLFEDDDRQLEFYHPEDSPTKGFLMEIYNPALQGKKLQDAIFGEMLHAAPSLSPAYKKAKQDLVLTFTPAQIESHKRAYEQSGDTRPFDKFMDVSRTDAFIRGYIANQWPDYPYTIIQRRMMDQMINDLHRSKSE